MTITKTVHTTGALALAAALTAGGVGAAHAVTAEDSASLRGTTAGRVSALAVQADTGAVLALEQDSATSAPVLESFDAAGQGAAQALPDGLVASRLTSVDSAQVWVGAARGAWWVRSADTWAQASLPAGATSADAVTDLPGQEALVAVSGTVYRGSAGSWTSLGAVPLATGHSVVTVDAVGSSTWAATEGGTYGRERIVYRLGAAGWERVGSYLLTAVGQAGGTSYTAFVPGEGRYDVFGFAYAPVPIPESPVHRRLPEGISTITLEHNPQTAVRVGDSILVAHRDGLYRAAADDFVSSVAGAAVAVYGYGPAAAAPDGSVAAFSLGRADGRFDLEVVGGANGAPTPTPTQTVTPTPTQKPKPPKPTKTPKPSKTPKPTKTPKPSKTPKPTKTPKPPKPTKNR